MSRHLEDIALKRLAQTVQAMQVGREWQFARRNVIEWVVNRGEADKLKVVLGKARVRGK